MRMAKRGQPNLLARCAEAPSAPNSMGFNHQNWGRSWWFSTSDLMSSLCVYRNWTMKFAVEDVVTENDQKTSLDTSALISIRCLSCQRQGPLPQQKTPARWLGGSMVMRSCGYPNSCMVYIYRKIHRYIFLMAGGTAMSFTSPFVDLRTTGIESKPAWHPWRRFIECWTRSAVRQTVKSSPPSRLKLKNRYCGFPIIDDIWWWWMISLSDLNRSSKGLPIDFLHGMLPSEKQSYPTDDTPIVHLRLCQYTISMYAFLQWHQPWKSSFPPGCLTYW